MKQEQGKFVQPKKASRKWLGLGSLLLLVLGLSAGFLYRNPLPAPEAPETTAATEPSETRGLLESLIPDDDIPSKWTFQEEQNEAAMQTDPTVPETEAPTETAISQWGQSEKKRFPVPKWKNDKKLTAVFHKYHNPASAYLEEILTYSAEFFTYNEKGMLTKVSDKPPQEDGDDETWCRIVYDSQDRVSEIWLDFGDGKGEFCANRYTYNDLGQLIAHSDHYAGQDADITFTYDENGRLSSRHSIPYGEYGKIYTEYFTYDETGRIASSQVFNPGNQEGTQYNFVYDEEYNTVTAEMVSDFPFGSTNYPMEHPFFYSVKPQYLRYFDDRFAITDCTGAVLWDIYPFCYYQVWEDEDGYPYKALAWDSDTSYLYYFLYDNEKFPQDESLKWELVEMYEHTCFDDSE